MKAKPRGQHLCYADTCLQLLETSFVTFTPLTKVNDLLHSLMCVFLILLFEGALNLRMSITYKYYPVINKFLSYLE